MKMVVVLEGIDGGKSGWWRKRYRSKDLVKWKKMKNDERKMKKRKRKKKFVILVPDYVIMPLVHIMPSHHAMCLKKCYISFFVKLTANFNIGD
jgi:hypothetical protein